MINFNTVTSRHSFPEKQRADAPQNTLLRVREESKTNEIPGNATVIDLSTRDASRSNWGALLGA